jgi:hypothetical protein
MDGVVMHDNDDRPAYDVAVIMLQVAKIQEHLKEVNAKKYIEEPMLVYREEPHELH